MRGSWYLLCNLLNILSHLVIAILIFLTNLPGDNKKKIMCNLNFNNAVPLNCIKFSQHEWKKPNAKVCNILDVALYATAVAICNILQKEPDKGGFEGL
uniref:Putative secreted protein n=1 Tax=Ixodes ricinus TaxID=34613 RepID=A0A6B0UFB7_IXORI